jgi:integral membrane protein (TIGR01906 family)
MRTFIGIILFPFLCLFLSLFVLLSDPAFTYLLLDNPNAVQITRQLLQYFEHNAEMPAIFAADEQSHLADVKHLLSYAYYILELLTVIVMFCMLDNWRKVIRLGSALLALLLLFAFLIPFDTFFTNFHKIFFPQGNWMFSADSTLITFYPTAFFMQFGISIAINALVAAFAFIIVSRKG